MKATKSPAAFSIALFRARAILRSGSWKYRIVTGEPGCISSTTVFADRSASLSTTFTE
jgi:hypothetical protein